VFVHPVTFQQQTGDDDLLAQLRQDEAARADSELTDPVSLWFPGIPSPSSFTTNRLSGRIVPRVPIRLNQSGDGVGNSNQGGGAPQKIDARSTRFTEIVQQILNGLITSGGIFKSGVADWQVAFIPRQVAGDASFPGELFFNTDNSKVCYKDSSQTIRVLG
jgi:hypothetical protein